MVLGGSLLLAACGGGSDGPGLSSLTLNGTAATGAPVVGGAVAASCKNGKGTATSNGDGSYTVVINNGAGPCLLSITASAPGSIPMFSITSGSGATQTANITPMTNMLVEFLRSVPGMNAASPEAWFALPSVGALLADTAALNKRIVADFIPALTTLGLSTSDASFLSKAFVADPLSSTTDADLEKLKRELAKPVVADAIAKALAAAAKAAPPVPVPATGAGS